MRSRALLATLSALLGVLVALPAQADDLAYTATGGASSSFGVIDLNTGVYTQTSLESQQLTGLAVLGGQLYGAAWDGKTLYSINTTTGALTALATSAGFNYFDIGSTTSGLYAVDGTGNLYSVSGTGATTLIGSTGLNLSALGTVGLSDNSNNLLLTANGSLYNVDTTSGAATMVGAAGSVGAVGAMVFEDGTLYGGVNHPTPLVESINGTTGAATPGAALSGTAGNFWGLAADPVTSMDEGPGMMELLLTMSFAGLALAYARKRMNHRAPRATQT